MSKSVMESYFENLVRKRNNDLWTDVAKQIGKVEQHLVSIGPEHLAKEKDTEPEPSFEELKHSAILRYGMNDLNSRITDAFRNQ